MAEESTNEKMERMKSVVGKFVRDVADTKAVIDESSDYAAIERAKDRLSGLREVIIESRPELLSGMVVADQLQAQAHSIGAETIASQIAEVLAEIQRLLGTSRE
jgi:hypothetical protein